jgi:hypothetical protein
MPLFTGVRGSGVLRTSPRRSSRKLGLRGYRKSSVGQSGRGPSFVGLRPLSWWSRWPTTSEGSVVSRSMIATVIVVVVIIVVAIVLLQFLR